MYVCMYVCMYICMHASMCVCIYVCLHACMQGSYSVCMYVCVHACTISYKLFWGMIQLISRNQRAVSPEAQPRVIQPSDCEI